MESSHRAPTTPFSGVKWWLRSLAWSAAVGLALGAVVGGTLGRIFMRVLFLAREDTLGFETAMGAIVGEFTSKGTVFIYGFAAFLGGVLGVAYAVGRTMLRSGTPFRTVVFTLGATSFLFGLIVHTNQEDFSFLPVTLSVLLVVASVALTALPLPVLVERLAPDHARRPGRFTQGVVALALTGFGIFGVTGIVAAYTT